MPKIKQTEPAKPHWRRTKYLIERGTFGSHMGVKRAIDRGEFSPGRLLSPGVRAWSDAEIESYENSRPTCKKTELVEG